jgi:PAS domain S-box-containing protein
MNITLGPLPKRPSRSFDRIVSHAVREQLLVLDAGRNVLAASRPFYAAFQVLPGETVGKNLADLGNGQWNHPALLALLQEQPKNEQPKNELPKKDGGFDDLEMEHDFPGLGLRTMLLSARRLSGSGAEPAMILLSILDITEQKRIEVEASVLSSRYRTILASIGRAVIVTDSESRIAFMNPIAEKLTGWSQNDALIKPLTEIFHIAHEGSSQAVESLMASAISQSAAVSLADPTVLIAADGGQRPIDGNAAPIIDAAGELAGVVLAFHDISKRREDEQNLEISEVRYRRLFEAAHDGIFILDAVSARILDVNPFMEDLLGYPREHFLQKELWEIGVFKDAETSKKAMTTLQTVGHIRYDDLPLEHKDGRHIPVEFVSNVYREGTRSVIQCNIRDVTERTRLAQALIRATREAETANRSKSEFLANMSHEIRTPMSAILGFADMLLHRSPEECAQAGCVQIIQRNALHLLELINEILDLSKVEAGQMKVERVSCDLPALLSEIVSLMRPRAAEKGLVFEVTFQGPIPSVIQTDPLRLRQILVNLLGNSVKFTQSGTIELRVADEGVGGPDILLRVDVIDSGIGMTPEMMGRLFIPFTQGDASITRKFGGTGLGLTISRQLATLLRGDVTVLSQPGVGSTFTLKIDGGPSAGVERLEGLTEASLPATADQKAETKIHLRGQILLVEDGADNQRLLRMQLGNAGASVTSALDGQIAVHLATTRTFDLILMDMQMPVMDGYAATTELRRRGLTLPIIALTAYAMSEDRDKCLAAGCSGYLSKPVDEEKLLKTVQEHLGQSGSPLPIDPTGAAQAGSPPPNVDPSGSNHSIKSSHSSNPRIMEIVPQYVAGLPVQVSNITELLEQNDLPAVQKIAHQLLGSAGGYGFASVSRLARTVEQSIMACHPLESIIAEVKSLIDLIRRIDGYDESKEAAGSELFK